MVRVLLFAALLAAPAPKPKVRLSLRSTPEARVHATWAGGKGACDTPCELRVPRKAQVELVFSAPEHLSFRKSVRADQDQEIDADLPANAPF